MERVYNDEERIRRAEVIAERRRCYDYFNEEVCEENSFLNKIVKKFMIQLFIVILIYSGVYYYANINEINKKRAFLTINSLIANEYDFTHFFYFIKNNCYSVFNKLFLNNQNSNIIDQNLIENKLDNNKINKDNEDVKNVEIENKEEKINNDNQITEQKVSFIKPLNNYDITSRYGTRVASKIVSANHTGIDLGANIGEDVLSSTSGMVDVVSNKGDYGNHIVISNGEYEILYAHCSDMFVNEGQQVEQGNVIAKVGSTGKSTGPHLHFEIKINGTSVNPESYINFN